MIHRLRLGPLQRIPLDGWVLLAITGVVLLANAPYLLHLVNPNPLGPKSDLIDRGVGGLLAGGYTIDPNSGYVSQALGHLAATDWLHLRLPWWNPYEGAGMPLAGEMQSAALFPPTLLLALSNGQLYEHILLELVAGWATYLLLRRLGLRRSACAAAATVFALNGTFAWFDHAAANPVALLPVLLLGLELAYAATLAGRRGGWWLISVAVALSIYAGFPETAYVDGLLAGAWLIWRAACARRGPLLQAFALKGLAGAVAGGLLAAPIIVAFADFLKVGYTGGFDTSATGHLESQALPQLVLPYVHGGIFELHDAKGLMTIAWGGIGGYLTMSLVVFGGIGLLARGHRGLRLTLGAWLVLALARMYGAPGVGALLGVLPGMSSVVFYRYATPSVELAACVLAAIGIDDLLRWPAARRRRVAGVAAVGLVVVAGAAFAARGLSVHLAGPGSRENYLRGAAAGGGAVVVVGLACTLLRAYRLRAAAICAVVVLEALVLFMVPELSAPRTVRTNFDAVGYLQANAGLERFATLGPFQPNYGSYFGVAAINSDDLPIPKEWAHYIHSELDQEINPLHFFGVNNYPSTPPADLPYEELFRNLAGYRAAGVAYVVIPSRLRLAGSNAHTFTKVFSARNATVYRLAGADPYFTASGGCQVAPRDRQAVRVSCAGPATLVRRETELPGATARVDGHAVNIHRSRGIFQSIDLAAGSHEITFNYRPPHMRLAYLAFLLGFGWVVLGIRGLPAYRRARAA
jgi:hypothetical protein